MLARLPKVRDYLEWYLDWKLFGHRPIDSIRAVEVEKCKRSRLLGD